MDIPSADPSPGAIVVGVDGSAPAYLAVAWAADQASLDRRPLTLLHATGPPDPVWAEVPPIDGDERRRNADAYARNLLDEAFSHVFAAHPELSVRQVRSQEDPRTALLDLSASAAMVVVGSRGRGPVRSLLLGSVSSAVATHAASPVVVLRPTDADVSGRPRHGVLVGVQGAAVERQVLELAYRLAASRGWHLTVLQCTSDSPADDGARRLDELVATMDAKFPDVVVAVRRQPGYVGDRLVDLAPSMDAVVLGSAHPGPVATVLAGSLAKDVVEHAHGTVVVLPLQGT